ncbi:MAG TPA: DUF6265 family protein [Roseateles sp.]|nr:DUF6265 family protein [Roseateles sp.]
MQKHSCLAALIVLSLCGAASAQGLERAAWLAGCWVQEDGEPGSVEQWTAPAGGVMLGVARTVKNGRTVAHEFLQIREQAGASLLYIAKPSGQAETQFLLAKSGEGELLFENPAHDFPQRIAYQRRSDGRLLARIEGRRANGETRTVDFPMRRTDCGANAAAPLPQRVRGEFDVKMAPQPGAEAQGQVPGRLLVDKRFFGGPLEGTSQGQMLAFRAGVPGSAGYVAMELFKGTLAGRRGSFVLQHSGTMNRGAPGLVISVVPDSGTEELAGLSGTMGIRIEGGKHYYDFDYSLPPAKP